MGSVTRSKRVKVIEAHACGLSISDCARLAKVSYETACRYVKEAQMLGAGQAVAQPSHRVWPVELKRQIGRRWLAGENSMALVKEYSLPGSSYPSLFGRWVEREEMVNHIEAAQGTGRRAIQAQAQGLSSEVWMKWVGEVRANIDAAKAQTPDPARRVELDQMHIDILEKSCALRDSAESRIDFLTGLVSALKASYSVSRLCSLIGLARSTYYAHGSLRVVNDSDIALIRAAFEYLRYCYGYRRITMLIKQGFAHYTPQRMNHKKVARLMRLAGIEGKRPRKKHYNSFTGTLASIPNVVDRQFHASKPGKLLVTDITQITWCGQKYYFSPLTNLYNNEIVSWRVSTAPEAVMVTGMIHDYLAEHSLAGAIVYTDQGWQYFSHEYRNLLSRAGAIQSMSRKAICLDNAPAEAIFARLKTELDLHTPRTGRPPRIRAVLEDYITWWNNERIINKLQTSPVTYRHNNYEQTA